VRWLSFKSEAQDFSGRGKRPSEFMDPETLFWFAALFSSKLGYDFKAINTIIFGIAFFDSTA